MPAKYRTMFDPTAAAIGPRDEESQLSGADEGAVRTDRNFPLRGPRVLIRDLRRSHALLAIVRQQFWFGPAVVVLAVLTSLFEGVGLTLVIPLMQSLGQEGAPQASRGYLGFLHDFINSIPVTERTAAVLALMFAAMLAKGAFTYANLAILAIVYGRIIHRLRIGIFSRLLSTPLAALERQPSGTLLNALTNETWRVTDAVNHIFTIITSLATAIVFVALLVLLDWKMALLAIGSLALISPIAHLVARRVKTLSKTALEANERLAQQAWSTINGLRTIHTFGREIYEQSRFFEISDCVRRLFLKLMLVNISSGPITETLAIGVIALLVLVGTKVGGVATLVAFVAILYRLQPRLTSLVGAQTQLASLHAPIVAVSKLIDGEPASFFCNEVLPAVTGRVSFRNVTFRYESDGRPTLQNFSFDFPTKGIIALVGASGAGKSTLLDLILGFQFPETGHIRIGEIALTETTAPAWRQRTGVVSQDPYIFDDTVRANILYGRLDASMEDVIRAAQAAAADEFIRSLPLGYDTRIGERAANLSGGQRQRIALARALLRNPDFLVLDEATNALDANTEAEFQVTLRNFAKERTVVLVAHKFSTLEVADHVVVLESGRLVEQGSPGGLLREGGAFASMFAAAPARDRVDTRGARPSRPNTGSDPDAGGRPQRRGV